MCVGLDAAFALVLSAAFILGFEHSFEADHIVAVSTIVTQGRGLVRSLVTGSLWGLGHTFTLLAAGMIVIMLRVRIPAVISNDLDYAVGLMLIVLGVWAVVNVKRQRLHFHVHSHDGKLHAHLHSHKENLSHDHPHIPFSVGVVHGLAGSGALVVLVMSTIGSVAEGLFFLAAFGGGLMIAMGIISAVLNLPISYGGRFEQLLRFALQTGAGVLSLVLGTLVLTGLLT